MEINKLTNKYCNFSHYALDWWNLKGNLKILHQINPLRLQYIINNVNSLYKKKIIDIGCGGGILTESLVKQGAEVTGLDICKELIDVAHNHAIKKNIKVKYLYQTVAEHAKKFKKYYDIITCMEMLEHTDMPNEIVSLCAKMLKPGGSVFFSTINRNKKSFLMAIIAAEYIMNFIPLGTHDIKKFIKPSELLSWVDQSKLLGINIIGLHYNFFAKKFFLASGVRVNYLLHARKIFQK